MGVAFEGRVHVILQVRGLCISSSKGGTLAFNGKEWTTFAGSVSQGNLGIQGVETC